ncbi:MAG: TolB family protein, partial [Candidatus Lokiarchaeia archaeon]
RGPDPGGGVNTESLDAHPFIDPNERYIIFDSDRAGGLGKSDLYVCFKNTDGSWGDAINMRELNSTEGDWCATVSPDGKYLFYTSNMDENIYWVDSKIIEELKPENLK